MHDDVFDQFDAFEGVDAPAQFIWESATAWPELSPGALHGILGKIVCAITPHTEADPAAMLVTALTMAGNMIGAGPHLCVGPIKHEAVIFAVIVGASAKARKGQSYAEVKRFFAEAEPELVETTAVSGLSTGEGLIARVRDRDDGEPVEKRAMIHEPEFARTLAVAARENATMSPILRDAWDRTTLRVLTRNLPLEARNAFCSFIGHITLEELTARLCDVQIANGFANRFLFACARRGPLLPHGGNLLSSEVERLGGMLRDALAVARTRGQMTRSPAFDAAWEELYRGFPEEPGLAGAIIARDAAQTLRLALVYALLDGATEVDLPHLKAAYALWCYCEDSAKHIFGQKLGDDVRQRLLDGIRASYPAGLDRTDQMAIFGGHAKAQRLDAARTYLIAGGLAVETREPSASGAPRKVLYATPPGSDRSRSRPLLGLNSHNSLNSQGTDGEEKSENGVTIFNSLFSHAVLDRIRISPDVIVLSPPSELSELCELIPHEGGVSDNAPYEPTMEELGDRASPHYDLLAYARRRLAKPAETST